MQKRTNPLELKVEVKQMPMTVEQETVEAVSQLIPSTVEESLDAIQTALAKESAREDETPVPAEETAFGGETVSTEEQPEKKKESVTKQTKDAPKKASAEQSETRKRVAKKEAPRQVQPTVIEADTDERFSPSMSTDVRWQRVVPQTAAPAPEESVVTPPVPEQPAPTPQASASASATYFRPVVDEEIEHEQDTYEEPMPEEEYEQLVATEGEEADTTAATGECIDDEQAALVLEDYEMSARFALRGRVSRGMKLTKISRDVCRLAQLMHPDQSLSAIIENALLTRIYLENRDAFDAMVDMIEKKGGRIKC